MKKKNDKRQVTKEKKVTESEMLPPLEQTTITEKETSVCKDSPSSEAKKDLRGVLMTRDRLSLKGYLFVVAFGILLLWSLNHLSEIGSGIGTFLGFFSPIIMGLGIAFIINSVLEPIERLWDGIIKSKKRPILKIKRPACLILSTIIVVGVVSAIIFMLIPELRSTAKTFASQLPDFLRSVETLLERAAKLLARIGFKFEEITLDPEKITETLGELVRYKGKSLFDKTLGITASVFSSVFNFILSFVFAFYVLAQKEKVGARLKRILYALTPSRFADGTVKVLALSGSTFSKFLTGQLIEAIIIGTLCFIGMLILNLPYAGVISVLIGATALIPIFGAFIGTAVGAVLILSVSLPKAIWFVIFIIALQQLESNLIYPRVVGKSLGLPGILVLASITVGGAMFGFFGILLAVPVCSVLYSLFGEFVSLRISAKEKGQK